jgi:hypothetical protein
MGMHIAIWMAPPKCIHLCMVSSPTTEFKWASKSKSYPFSLPLLSLVQVPFSLVRATSRWRRSSSAVSFARSPMSMSFVHYPSAHDILYCSVCSPRHTHCIGNTVGAHCHGDRSSRAATVVIDVTDDVEELEDVGQPSTPSTASVRRMRTVQRQ